MEDRQKILRELGISEVALALMIWQKATTAKSETVQLNAMKLLASMHGLLKDESELPPSIPIKLVFEGGEDEAPEDRSTQEEQKHGKPVAIIK